MTNPTEIIGWRNVATHGQPPKAVKVLALPLGFTRGAVVCEGADFTTPDTRWIPVSELATLPDAPPPPRTVTIEISEGDARWWLGDYNTDRVPTPIPAANIAATVASALAALDGGS